MDALRSVGAGSLASFASAFPVSLGRARWHVRCMRCWRCHGHARPSLHEGADIAPHMRKLVQCFIHAKALLFHERCNAAPQFAICVQHFFGGHVAEPVPELPHLRALLADSGITGLEHCEVCSFRSLRWALRFRV